MSAVTRVRVRAKSILESVRDVRAMCDRTLHTSWDKIAGKRYILEHPFLLWNILFCFRISYSVLEHSKS